MPPKVKGGKKPNKAELQAQLAVVNQELQDEMLKYERQFQYAEERRWEAVRTERLLEQQLRDLQDQLKEISLRRRRLVCDLVGQQKVMQQREAAEIRTLQAKLDHTHHVAATQVQALKQVVIQRDNEIADAEQSLKELRVRCERLVESFVKLLNETLEMMERELAAPLLQKLHTTEQFTAKVESYKAEFIAKIDAFFAEKEEQQPLGAAWRGMGLVPPSVVTKLDL